MATNGNWTIVFDDKTVIKNFAEGATEGIGYAINDDAFWSQSKFSNIWAIQHGSSNSSDEVEYRDDTPHSSYDVSVLGNISEFSNRWDTAHLSQLQTTWDEDNRYDENGVSETEAEKIARLGARPTSYSS
mgnify:CR=1 FL=1|jgi:hypothetical protein|tara:strand:+ start:228 stop:617 length:390 start_codon:yes stop_codon:yes gene_type:complete